MKTKKIPLILMKKERYVTPKVQIDYILLEESIAAASAQILTGRSGDDLVYDEWNDTNIINEDTYNW